MLSALWAALMFCYIYGDCLGLYVPGKLRGMLAGRGPLAGERRFADRHGVVAGGAGTAGAFVADIGAAMVSLAEHRARSVLCGDHVADHARGWWFYITLGAIEVVLSLLIVVYAWRCWSKG